jgi:hypothetical protein
MNHSNSDSCSNFAMVAVRYVSQDAQINQRTMGRAVRVHLDVFIAHEQNALVYCSKSSEGQFLNGLS